MRNEAHVLLSTISVAAGSSLRQQLNDRDVCTRCVHQKVIRIVGSLRLGVQRETVILTGFPISDFRLVQSSIDIYPCSRWELSSGLQLNTGSADRLAEQPVQLRPVGLRELLALRGSGTPNWDPFAVRGWICFVLPTSTVAHSFRDRQSRGRKIAPTINPSWFEVVGRSLVIWPAWHRANEDPILYGIGWEQSTGGSTRAMIGRVEHPLRI
jgi:hypothetical protein